MRRNSRRRAQDRRQPSREGKATPASARLSLRTSSALSAELFRAWMTGFCHFRKKSGDGNEGLTTRAVAVGTVMATALLTFAGTGIHMLCVSRQ